MVRTFILMFYGWFLAFILYVNFIYAFDLFDTLPSLLPGITSTSAIDVTAHPDGSFFGVSSFISWFQNSLDFESQFPLYKSILGSLSSINRSMGWVWNKTSGFFDWISSVGYTLGIGGSSSIIAFLTLLVSGFGMLLVFAWAMVILALIIAYIACFILMLIAFVVELFMSLQLILAGYVYSPLPHNPYVMNWFN